MSDTQKDWTDDLKMENLAFYETLDPEALADSEDLSTDDPQAFGETINPLADLDAAGTGMAHNQDGLEDEPALSDDEHIQAELSRLHSSADPEDDKP